MQLFNGDCLEVLRGLPDNCIDLVVTDPPYMQVTTGGGLGSRPHYKELDGISSNFDLHILEELERVQKQTNIYIFCSKQQIKQYLEFYDGKNFDLLTWHKRNPLPACGSSYLPDTEYLLFFRDPGVPIFGTYETKHKFFVTDLNAKDKAKYGHPTIKPLEIIENLVINSSIRGGVRARPVYGERNHGCGVQETRARLCGN